MTRPREFDRDKALSDAMQVFWAKGFAATSTDDLLQAMGIGRQSMYNAFGDKRQLYLDAFNVYLQGSIAAHLKRLDAPASPLEGIANLLAGLAPEEDHLRSLGCMGVCSVGEFGASDVQIADLRSKAAQPLSARLVARLKEGQLGGEVTSSVQAEDAARFIQMSMSGLQVAARSGARAAELATLVSFIVDRLRVPQETGPC